MRMKSLLQLILFRHVNRYRSTTAAPGTTSVLLYQVPGTWYNVCRREVGTWYLVPGTMYPGTTYN